MPRRARSPETIQFERQKMVQEIVARRDLREHLANFFGGFCFGSGAFGPGPCHRRRNLTHFKAPRRSLTAAIRRGVIWRTRSTASTGTLSYVRAWPRCGDRTKRKTPLRAFLSERIAFTSRSEERRVGKECKAREWA